MYHVDAPAQSDESNLASISHQKYPLRQEFIHHSPSLNLRDMLQQIQSVPHSFSFCRKLLKIILKFSSRFRNQQGTWDLLQPALHPRTLASIALLGRMWKDNYTPKGYTSKISAVNADTGRKELFGFLFVFLSTYAFSGITEAQNGVVWKRPLELSWSKQGDVALLTTAFLSLSTALCLHRGTKEDWCTAEVLPSCECSSQVQSASHEPLMHQYL